MGRKPVTSKRFIGGDAVSNVEQGGGYVTINADYTSEIFNVSSADKISIHFQWKASTLSAEIIVQVRNGDEDIDDWRELDFGTAINISSASGEHDILITEVAFTDLRIFVDRASGSGDIGATITTKAVGA